MRNVSAGSESSLDIIDLKFLPAWVRETETAARYADFAGEDEHGPAQIRPQPGPAGRGLRDWQRNRDRRQEKDRRRQDRSPREQDRRNGKHSNRTPEPAATRKGPVPLPQLEVRFLPDTAALENVVAQIKETTAAYSLYALAHLFLQKPERYDVRITSQRPFFRVVDSDMVALERGALESTAFRALRDNYYKTEITLNEPIKGNFTSVARERTSGTLLGPTNHHNYQTQLRRLYEQHFSRRMPFAEFQRQIEIVANPALVEQWKEEARKVTTFTTIREETPQTFNAEPEVERHFREKYFPALIIEVGEAVIDGVTSRKLRDRGIARVIENAWTAEGRSPSNMMQELAARLRNAGLHIFRHRRGMLFVSPIRPKAIDETAVSDSVRGILEALRTAPRISRKELAEKLIASKGEEGERTKLALASDLLWLIREGHVVEFNDGSLDLPRVKPTKAVKTGAAEIGSIEARPAETESEHASANLASSVPSRADSEGPGENRPDARDDALRSAQDHPEAYSPTTFSEGSMPS